MSRQRPMRRLVVVALAFAAPVFADAPVNSRDQQYENFDASDRWIVDRWTKLAWERPTSYGSQKSFVDAKTSCPGRRLPTIKELLTLVDESPHEEYDSEKGANRARAIDRLAFPKTPPSYFWSSSTGSDGRVWVVDFSDGSTALVKSDNTSAYVRCVDDVF